MSGPSAQSDAVESADAGCEQPTRSGVIESPEGVEVMLTRSDGAEWRTIGVGGTVLGAKLVEASGERAVFLIDDARWAVSAGGTLADRVPADSVH